MGKNEGIQKKYRRLQKAIRPHKLRIMCYGRSGHPGVYDADGKRLCTMSGTPTYREQAESKTFKWLQQNGHVPLDTKL